MEEPKQFHLIPTVIEKSQSGERAYDIYSRLLEEHIVFLGGSIDDDVANTIVAQFLFLEHKDAKKDIQFYINSRGGSVSAMFAIYDTMQFIKPDVSTICVGYAASAAAVLLAGGAKGKRYALSNSEVMLHQVLGGAQGQASDVEIHAGHLLKMKERINALLSKHTGQNLNKVQQDTDRDFFLDSREAKKYGVVDKVIGG